MYPLEEILNPFEFQLWSKYQEQESRGLKKQAKALLNEFIERLKKYPEQGIDKVALTLCELRYRGNIVIKHNLFKEVCYPTILRNIRRGTADYYRLLVTFEQQIYSDKKLHKEITKELKLNTDYFDSIEVLERELSIKSNQKAAILLINKIAWQLDFALHEIPIGILYEVEMIETFLIRLTELLAEYQLFDNKWRRRIEYVQITMKHWKKYVSNYNSDTFENYLSKVNTPETQLITNWNSALYDMD